MTAFHGCVRSVLSEINVFLYETLSQEKLSRKVIQHKEKIQELIIELETTYPQLKTSENGDFTMDEHVSVIAAKDLCHVTKAGFMEKRRKKEVRLRSIYQKRYCVIEHGVFYYYVHPTDKKQAGAFFLKGYKFHKAPYLPTDPSKGVLSFELTGPRRRTYQFLAESKQDMEEWEEAVYKFNGLENKNNKANQNQSITMPATEDYEQVDLPDENNCNYDQSDDDDESDDESDDDEYIIPKKALSEVIYFEPVVSNDLSLERDRPTPPLHGRNGDDHTTRNYPPLPSRDAQKVEEQKVRKPPPPQPTPTSTSSPADPVRPAPRTVFPPKAIPPRPPVQQDPKPGETPNKKEKMHPAVLPPKPPVKSGVKGKTPPPVAPKVARKPPKMSTESNDSDAIYDDVVNRHQNSSNSDGSYDDDIHNVPPRPNNRQLSEEPHEILNEPLVTRDHEQRSREETHSSIYSDAVSGVP